MKKSRLTLILTLTGLALVLSACASGVRVTGTPGLSISDDMVFVAYGNTVRGISTETGFGQWQFPEEVNNRIMFYAQPYVTDESIFVGDVANNFYKLDKATGKLDWTFSDAKGFFLGKANGEDTVVYAPSNDGNLYALDAENGDMLWSFKTGHYIWAQPVLSDDAIFVASMDQSIYAIDRKGNQIWEQEQEGAVVGNPVLSDDGKLLFAGTTGKQVLALDAATGEQVWAFDANGSLESVWGNMILVDDVLIFSDSSGKIFALDSQMSTIKWQIGVPGAVVGGVVELPDGFAVVLLENETSLVKTFDFDGGAKWEASLSGEVFQAPVVNQSLLVVGTLNGDNLLYAYNLTGVQVWSYNPER